jgi:hypothetical protein
MYVFILAPMLATYLVHLIIFELIALMFFIELTNDEDSHNFFNSPLYLQSVQ